MSGPRVKICGITRLDDAELAVRLGAHALGFVFWPESPRAISAHAARAIASALPALVTRVGVFVDAPAAEVAEIVRQVGLDAVQLHGDESVDTYRAVRARLIKAVTLETDEDVGRVASLPTDVTLLVDAVDRARRGGTGRVADWRRVAQIAEARPVILSGGLTAENVTEAIATVRPWAVDVSSGVEARPGVKSADRLERFFAAIAAAGSRSSRGTGAAQAIDDRGGPDDR